MKTPALREQLLHSDRWVGFLESTAMALQVNIVPVLAGDNTDISFPSACPLCRARYPAFSREEKERVLEMSTGGNKELETGAGRPYTVVALQNGLCVIVQSCPHCSEPGGNNLLLEKSALAKKLLKNFLASLSRELHGGQMAVELSTLRQMNRIVLSLFRRENRAAQAAFDLILSALVLLLDARGSCLAFTKKGRHVSMVKGEYESVQGRFSADQMVEVELTNEGIQGKLGVSSPADKEQARALLPLMAQECFIIFEIERLFELLQTQLSKVLGSIGNAVLLVNRAGNIIYANGAAAEIFDHPLPGLISKGINDIPGPWSALIKAGGEESESGYMEPVERGGEVQWVDWQVSPLREGAEIAGWVIMAEDRTDYYNWQEAARRAERLAVTGTMVGGLAHELRNPLAAARGLVQLMSKNYRPEKVQGYSDLVLKEIDRATGLLNEFLLLGKPADLSAEPLDPVELLKEMMPLLEGEAYSYGVEIRTCFKDVPGIAADRGQLTQVVLNLGRNAVQAVGQNGLVEVSVDSDGDNVKIAFKDNGPGLPPQIREKLFRPFFTTKEQGTGLGLPVVQAIVRNHGGKLTATDAPGGGALFTVTLPAFSSPGETACPVKVLVLMEDEFLRYPAEQALREAGFRVASASGLNDPMLSEHEIYPVVVVLEESFVTGGEIRDIERKWPRAKILAVCDNVKDCEEQYWPYCCIGRPLEYTRLISTVKQMLQGGNTDCRA